MNVTQPGTSYYWLDPVAQWRGTWSDLEERPTDQSLVLEPLPTADRQLFTKLGQGGPCAGDDALQCPVAIAADQCHGILVVDAANARVFQADITTEAAHVLAGVGGIGTAPRQFARARGIAILPDGSFAVLDAGTRRIAVFSPDPYALLALIPTGSASQPTGIAACGNVLFVSDSAGKQILVFDREGNGRPAIGVGELTAPAAVATFENQVAVLDATTIVLFSSSGAATAVPLPAGFRYEGLAFDEYGALYAGAVPQKGIEGSIIRVAMENGAPIVAGFGALGLEGRVTAFARLGGAGLLAIIYSATSRQSSVWRINPQGACVSKGIFTSDVLDSHIDRCAWHRIVCEGRVPAGTSITVETVTGATVADCVWSAAAVPLTVKGDDVSGLTDPDFLVQGGAGRYLRFRLTICSSVKLSPVITGIRVEFPRQSYLQYLPAVLQEDPDSRSFQDRFLSLFQTYFDDQDDCIDKLWKLFSPAAVPDQYLAWLAAIVALPTDPTWAGDKRRQMLGSVFAYDPATNYVTGKYPARGTPAQVEQDIVDYSGAGQVGIVEHFRLRGWLDSSEKFPLGEESRQWSRDIYQRLQVAVYSQLGYFKLLDQPEPALEPLAWGAHRFSVFFPAHPYTVEATRQKVAQAVEMAKPAHTQATLCPVLPRLRVEYQSTIEIDTVLGEVHDMVLGGMATLDYDAVLAGPQGLRALAASGLEAVPQAGITTTLQ